MPQHVNSASVASNACPNVLIAYEYNNSVFYNRGYQLLRGLRWLWEFGWWLQRISFERMSCCRLSAIQQLFAPYRSILHNAPGSVLSQAAAAVATMGAEQSGEDPTPATTITIDADEQAVTTPANTPTTEPTP